MVEYGQISVVLKFGGGKLYNLGEIVKEFIIQNVHKVLISSIIILVGMFLIKKLNKIFSIFCRNIKVTSSEFNVFNWGIKTLIYFAMFSLVSSQFELKIWSTIASISASVVALSVVFKDNVSNFISGMSILINKLIHINDIVQIGSVKGKVVKIGSLCTYLITEDKRTIIIPNSKIISEVVIRESEWDLTTVSLMIKVKKIYSQEINRNESKMIKLKINKVISIKEKYISDDPPPIMSFELEPEFVCAIGAYVQKNEIDKLQSSIYSLLTKELEKYRVEVAIDDK